MPATESQVKKEFLKHFVNPNANAENLHKLRNLKMNGNVQQYSDEFITLLHKIGWDSASDVAIYQYKSGLPRWIVSHLSTAESQYLISMELLGQIAPPINVEVLAKLSSQIEANNRIYHQLDSRDKIKEKMKEKRSYIHDHRRVTNMHRCTY